jgi:hypothetical protein
MEPGLICQSCTMPIDDPGDRGTEKDGTASTDYCKYCYKDGSFTDPALTLNKMHAEVTAEMKKQHSPPGFLQKSLDALPHLKRWKNMQA